MKMPAHVKEFFQKQGKVGGKKRSAKLSPERRKEIAQRVAKARWANKTGKREPKGK
jgi:hypothetical protein